MCAVASVSSPSKDYVAHMSFLALSETAPESAYACDARSGRACVASTKRERRSNRLAGDDLALIHGHEHYNIRPFSFRGCEGARARYLGSDPERSHDGDVR